MYLDFITNYARCLRPVVKQIFVVIDDLMTADNRPLMVVDRKMIIGDIYIPLYSVIQRQLMLRSVAPLQQAYSIAKIHFSITDFIKGSERVSE